MQRTLTQAGHASPEDVWRRYADLDEWLLAPFDQALDSGWVRSLCWPCARWSAPEAGARSVDLEHHERAPGEPEPAAGRHLVLG